MGILYFSSLCLCYLSIIFIFFINPLDATSHVASLWDNIHEKIIHGVKMGVKNSECDDATNNLDIDWPGFSTEVYACNDDDGKFKSSISKSEVICHPNEGANDPRQHQCMDVKLEYKEQIPVSGNHRPNWAKYGEYIYLPPPRWMHNLEHGAVIFLYHPCAKSEDVNILRNLLTSCLRRHIITPSKRLTNDKPFALVSWGCKILMSYPDIAAGRKFILEHARHTEEDLSKEGLYTLGLVKAAEIVSGSDYEDSSICPQQTSDDTVKQESHYRDIDMTDASHLM